SSESTIKLWVKLKEGPPPTTAIFLGHPASSPTSLLLLFISPSHPPFDFFLTSLFFFPLAFCILRVNSTLGYHLDPFGPGSSFPSFISHLTHFVPDHPCEFAVFLSL
ncbi:hypothetical protein N7455_011836, partial [Penicillium solitum]|uniref:uncharacterized protein n=1 Tax=Penicillium solitum TaxID=60172 RepID=UPI0032C450FB